MAGEQFSLAASRSILQLLDRASAQVGLSRGQVFEDFLTVSRCALAGQTMEEEYLATVGKGYGQGTPGKRGIDTLKEAFHSVIDAMEGRDDVLGDIFTGAITYGEKGQFFTPGSICELMASMSIPPERTGERKSVCDPACGSGRMLLAVGKLQPHWELTGQDADHRAAQMTAINLGLNGLRGWAVWQNTLTLECHRVYRIGFNLASGGVITEVPVQQSPFNYGVKSNLAQPKAGQLQQKPPGERGRTDTNSNDSEPPRQLDLF